MQPPTPDDAAPLQTGPSPTSQPPPPPGSAAVAGPAPGLVYAGFWWRVLALLIDGILLSVVFFVGARAIVKGIDYGNGNVVITEGQWFFYVWGIIAFLYYPVTWVAMGETIGHRVLGMEVRRVQDGQRIDVGKAIIRYLGYLLSSLLLGIPFLIAAFDSRKQALHDRLANTVVVRKVAT
jgi:uncharacterized RDD family membrane protein YckC